MKNLRRYCGEGSSQQKLGHISQACSWSLMELAPFPSEDGMVAGVSLGQSLHPS